MRPLQPRPLLPQGDDSVLLNQESYGSEHLLHGAVMRPEGGLLDLIFQP